MAQSMPTSSTGATQSWDYEGGNSSPRQLAESLGVVCHATETYSVGSYKYTNLADAIAQARRMAKLERELL